MIKRQNGFTLLELLIVLVVVGITAMVAVPGYNNLVERNRMTSLTNDMTGALNYARSEAVRRNTAVIVQPIDTTEVDDGEPLWNSGMRIRLDNPPDGEDGFLRAIDAPGRGVTVQIIGGGEDLRFRSNGERDSNTTGFRICGERTSPGREIRINESGQVRKSDGGDGEDPC